MAFVGAGLAGTQVLTFAAVGLGVLGRSNHSCLIDTFSWLPFLSGAGGVGANMIAQSMCTTPYCTALSGQCCLLVLALPTGLQCPESC